jgi:hypothetical protein
MISVSRWAIITLAALFSTYHIVLGIVSMSAYRDVWPVIVALCLYAVATVLSLADPRELALPVWVASFDLGIAVTLPLLVQSQLDAMHENGYATWYVAAVGTLLTIVVVRRRAWFAVVGIVFLIVHTVVVVGVSALGTYGVIGSAVWVAAAAVVTYALGSMARDAARLARAERQVVEWQAEQEAHIVERQRRLDETYGRAAPLLTRIADGSRDLTAAERAECRLLEAGMRDEIRGRTLLDDAVRTQVLSARRRGASVTLLDDGGLDDVAADDLAAVHAGLAEAIQNSRADKYIVRTVASGSETAVTVVGLRTGAIDIVASTDDGAGTSSAETGSEAHGPRDAVDAAAAESEGEDDEVVLWLELPRHAGAAVES